LREIELNVKELIVEDLKSITDEFVQLSRNVVRMNTVYMKTYMEVDLVGDDETIRYVIPYSKTFSDVVENDFKRASACYINYTVTDSTVANDNRFVKKTYLSTAVSHNTVKLDRYNFDKGNLTTLYDMDLYETVGFIRKYLELIRIRYLGGKVEEIEIDSDGLPVFTLRDKPKAVAKRPAKTKSIHTKTQGKTMNTLMTAAEKTQAVVSQAVQINKEAGILAAKLEVGRVVTKQIKEKIKLPFGAGGMKKHPLFDIALANIVGVALREVAPGNEKAQILSEAMIQSAAVEMVQSFDVNSMINDLIKNVDLSALTGKS